jgi:hypothetical protein
MSAAAAASKDCSNILLSDLPAFAGMISCDIKSAAAGQRIVIPVPDCQKRFYALKVPFTSLQFSSA